MSKTELLYLDPDRKYKEYHEKVFRKLDSESINYIELRKPDGKKYLTVEEGIAMRASMIILSVPFILEK